MPARATEAADRERRLRFFELPKTPFRTTARVSHSSGFVAFARQTNKHIGVVTFWAALTYNLVTERRCVVITNLEKTLLTAQLDAAGSSYSLAPI